MPDTDYSEERALYQDRVKSIIGTVCCMLCVLIVGIVVAKAVAATSLERMDKDVYCHTTECLRYEELLSLSLDRTQDPCNNFYRFVCNGWDLSHQASLFREHFRDYVNLIVKEALSMPIPETSQNAMEKAARYYLSCLELAEKNRSEVEDFKEELLHGNITWPKVKSGVDFLKVMAYAKVNWDSSPILSFGKTFLPNGTAVVSMSPGAFVSTWANVRGSLVEAQEYDKYYAIAYALLGHAGFDEGTLSKSKAIESKLTASFAKAAANKNVTSIDETVFETLGTAFRYDRWRRYFNDVLGILPNQPVLFTVTSLDFFIELNAVTLVESEAAMTLFLGWGVINEIGLLFLPDMNIPLQETMVAARRAAEVNCQLNAKKYFGVAAALPYISKTISQEAYEDVTTMYRVINSLVQRYLRILHFDYLDYQRSKTPVAMFGDMDKIVNVSQIDAQFAAVPDMGTSFFANLKRVVAARRLRLEKETDDIYLRNYSRLYDPRRRDIVIRPSAMIPPIYARALPLAVRYGALGSLIATGIAEDLYTNAVPPMESPSKEKFLAARACVQNTRSGALYLTDETIYWTIASKILKHSYTNALPLADQKRRKEERGFRLRTLPEYGGQQLMFIVSCYLRCRGSGGPYEEECNAPMRNLRDFSLAFRCNRSSAMNPKDKCTIFPNE